MAAVTQIYVPPYSFDRQRFGGGLVMMETVAAVTGTYGGKYRAYSGVCRSFRSEEGENGRKKKKSGGLRALRYAVERKSEELSSRLGELLASGVLKVEDALSKVAVPVARYVVTMMSTGVVLAVGFQMSGTMIGANMVLDEHCRCGPRNVVITGSTRGLGKALAREFLLSGDHVVVASRSPDSVKMTIKELEEIIQEGVAAGDSRHKNLASAKVVGIACDVCNHDDVKRLADYAVSQFGSIDIWINNAGMNKGFRPLLEFTDEDITQIVSTNLIGSLLCTREAMRVMKNQGKGGHIFNMDGAGSGGSSTPLTAAYGATKCGLRQLQSSLLKECKRSNIGVHTASPGMVLTDLLLSGSTIQNKQMFNIICELPETVARTLVPRIRIVKGNGRAINYLTPPRILLALVTAWLRQGRWFDDQGRALYSAEADRIRNWAEDRTRFSFTDAMEMYTENTWVSVFSLSVVCAFIILSSTSGSSM